MHQGHVERLCRSAIDPMQPRFGLPTDVDLRMRDELQRFCPRLRWRVHDGLHGPQFRPFCRRDLQWNRRGRVVRGGRLDATTRVACARGRSRHGVGGVAQGDDSAERARRWLPDRIGPDERELDAPCRGRSRVGATAAAKANARELMSFSVRPCENAADGGLNHGLFNSGARDGRASWPRPPARPSLRSRAAKRPRARGTRETDPRRAA